MNNADMYSVFCSLAGMPAGLCGCIQTGAAWWVWVSSAIVGQFVGFAGAWLNWVITDWLLGRGAHFVGEWLATVLYFVVPLGLLYGTAVAAFSATHLFAEITR